MYWLIDWLSFNSQPEKHEQQRKSLCQTINIETKVHATRGFAKNYLRASSRVAKKQLRSQMVKTNMNTLSNTLLSKKGTVNWQSNFAI